MKNKFNWVEILAIGLIAVLLAVAIMFLISNNDIQIDFEKLKV